MDTTLQREQAQSLAKVLRLLGHAQDPKRSKLAAEMIRCADELDALVGSHSAAGALTGAMHDGIRLGEQATKFLQREAAGSPLRRISRAFSHRSEPVDPMRLASMLLAQLRLIDLPHLNR